MAIERIYYCESPDCHGGSLDDGDHPPAHVKTAVAPPYLPHGWIETRERADSGDYLHHFCSWDCCMKFAAKEPIPEIIELSD